MTKRIPELDGIRGLAIVLVMVWHFFAQPLLRGHGSAQVLGRALMFTWSGVDLFFVLSGFLIGGILIDAKGSGDYFSKFYTRRFFRILPLYGLACLAYFPISYLVQFPIHCRIAHMPWYVYATFTQNIWLNDGRWTSFLCQTWSLAVEEQFYLTLPLLIWLVSARHLWKVVTAGIVGAIAFRIAFHANAPTSAYVLLPCRADTLLLGVLAAIAFRNAEVMRQIEARRAWLFLMVAVWLVSLGWFAIQNEGLWTRKFSIFGYSGFGIFYVSLLLLTLTSKGSMKKFFSDRLLGWFGTVAYGLYLVHLPVLNASSVIFRRFPMFALIIAITASLVLSHISWTLLESRMIAIGHHLTARSWHGQAENPRVRNCGLGTAGIDPRELSRLSAS